MEFSIAAILTTSVLHAVTLAALMVNNVIGQSNNNCPTTSLTVKAAKATGQRTEIARMSAIGNFMVTNVGIVTSVSGNINNVFSVVSTSTTGPNLTSMGQHLQTLVGQFTVIVNYLGTDITAMQAMPPALGSFVQVHKVLLATVIGKYAIFVQFGATAPVAAVLRTLEATIDSFAFAMINLIPCGADSVRTTRMVLTPRSRTQSRFTRSFASPAHFTQLLSPFVSTSEMTMCESYMLLRPISYFT
ncbi:hypothetical protein B0H16DRAFT_1883668, partial [Mycena metata]